MICRNFYASNLFLNLRDVNVSCQSTDLSFLLAVLFNFVYLLLINLYYYYYYKPLNSLLNYHEKKTALSLSIMFQEGNNSFSFEKSFQTRQSSSCSWRCSTTGSRRTCSAAAMRNCLTPNDTFFSQ